MHKPRATAFGGLLRAAPAASQAPAARLIVVRGDLFSDTGYARATRALEAALASHASRMFGVSLHAHGSRRQNAIDFPLVSDSELQGNPMFRDALVLNVCLPDHFVRVGQGFNIGYFFWETEVLPRSRFWRAQALMMDRVWAPSRWQSDFWRAAGHLDDVPVIPWPLDVEPAPCDKAVATLARARCHAAMSAEELDNYLLRASPQGNRTREKQLEAEDHADGRSTRFDPGRSPTFGELHAREGDLFVAVQTDAPRKGLPLLLTSWLRFKASPEGRNAKLIVKMSSLDVTADMYRIHFHASLAVRRAAQRGGIAQTDIWFVHDRLSSDEIRVLLGAADALVSATMGEGFGGPIAEALLEGTPVIAPRHTSLQEILRADYPLIVASEPHHLKLWNNIDVYSDASRWHVVDDDSFKDHLRTFARLSGEQRHAIAVEARDALLAHAGRAAVDKVLHVELARCAALRRDVADATTPARAVSSPPNLPNLSAAPC